MFVRGKSQQPFVNLDPTALVRAYYDFSFILRSGNFKKSLVNAYREQIES